MERRPQTGNQEQGNRSRMDPDPEQGVPVPEQQDGEETPVQCVQEEEEDDG